MTEPAPKNQAARSEARPTTSYKLFLGGLSWETTEETLQSHFTQYGELADVVVMRDRVTGTPKGFGFITFKSESAANEACKNSHSIDGRSIEPKPSIPQGQGQSQHSSSKKLFVGGLSSDTKDEHLIAYFQKYGNVLGAEVMFDRTNGRSKGFGFVTFDSDESVLKVLRSGQMHEINSKQVEVKPATPKGSGPQSGRMREPGSEVPGYGYYPGRYGVGRGFVEYRPGPYPMGSGYAMPSYGIPMGAQYQPPSMGAFPGYPQMMMNYPGYTNYGAYGGFPQRPFPRGPVPTQRFGQEVANQSPQFNGRRNVRRAPAGEESQ